MPKDGWTEKLYQHEAARLTSDDIAMPAFEALVKLAPFSDPVKRIREALGEERWAEIIN